jgi:5-methylcytosine-specific restriction endonuclease McrA
MRFCVQPGCGVLVPRGRCAIHADARPNRDTRRWYYLARWSRLRDRVLREAAYTCAKCQHVELELEVDHIVKHHGDPARFWDRANLQPLCRSCHQSKTAQGA